MSAKTVAEKLLIKPDTTLWCSDAARLGLLGPLPDGVRLLDGSRRPGPPWCSPTTPGPCARS